MRKNTKKLSEADRLRLLFQVATLRYVKKWTNTDIANEIKVSSTHVARLLDEAEAQDILRIDLRPPRLLEFKRKLLEKYRWLDDAVVVPAVEPFSYQRELLGKVAAEYFEEHVKDGMRVAIAGGDMIYDMVAELPDRARQIDIYPSALIGRGPTISHIDPLVLVTLLWTKSGRIPGRAFSVTLLPFEAKSNATEVRREYVTFLKRKKVNAVYQGMQKVDIVFASIGSLIDDESHFDTAQLSTLNLVSEMAISKQHLKKDGAVGDINYSYFDENGDTDLNKWHFFITLDAQKLRQMIQQRQQVVVVAGRHKKKALKAAVAGRLVSVVITDEQAAEELLS